MALVGAKTTRVFHRKSCLPTRFVNALGLLRCLLLGSADAEFGPGLAAAEEKTRSVTASLLWGACPQHGMRTGEDQATVCPAASIKHPLLTLPLSIHS